MNNVKMSTKFYLTKFPSNQFFTYKSQCIVNWFHRMIYIASNKELMFFHLVKCFDGTFVKKKKEKEKNSGKSTSKRVNWFHGIFFKWEQNCTVLKIRKLTLTHFWQKFRESNGFTKKVIWRNFLTKISWM